MKLIFKVYKKNNEIILTGYYEKKAKKSFQKSLVKDTKIFMKKEKKRAYIFENNIEILLKKKKKRKVNMVVNDINVSLVY